MKVGIVYFSLTGNTHRLAGDITERLRAEGGEVTLYRLAESRQYSFLGNCLRSLFRIKGNVEGVDFNPVDYDFILLGSPVWAGSPAPALNTFLEKVSPLSGKSVCLFVTYGSGLGKDRALRIMKEKVEGKGGQVTQMLSVCEKEPFMEVVKRFKFE